MTDIDTAKIRAHEMRNGHYADAEIIALCDALDVARGDVETAFEGRDFFQARAEAAEARVAQAKALYSNVDIDSWQEACHAMYGALND